LSIRKEKRVVMIGDGQVTMGNVILKHNAKKIRRLYNDKILAGFAGTTADAFTLFERFEGKLNSFSGNLVRSAVELAKDWRTDKILQRLEALLLVADSEKSLLISGSGDVVEPDENIMAAGSGGPYALSAAKALLKFTNLDIREIALEAMKIASSLCIYTNSNFIIEEINA